MNAKNSTQKRYLVTAEHPDRSDVRVTILETDSFAQAAAAWRSYRTGEMLDRRDGILVIPGQTYSRADYDAEQWRQRRAHLDAHPEISERAEIESMLEQAARLIEDTEYDLGYNLRHQAEQRLAAWRERYPIAAAEEDARHLEAKAEHLRELAVGALVYDADGWITSEIRQARHDKMMAEAAELDRQAAEIRSKI